MGESCLQNLHKSITADALYLITAAT